MSFTATGAGTAPSDQLLENNGFWPDIDPTEFRAERRIDQNVTAERAEAALIPAITETNRMLRGWQAQQLAAGYTFADRVPVPAWQAPGAFVALYRRAVFAVAHASLIEAYRDFDATNSTRDRADRQSDASEAYRRDARWAVSEILDRPHATVELI